MPLHVHSKCRKIVLAVISFDLGLAPAGAGNWRHCDEWWLSSSQLHWGSRAWSWCAKVGLKPHCAFFNPVLNPYSIWFEKQQLWKMHSSSKSAFLPCQKALCTAMSISRSVCIFITEQCWRCLRLECPPHPTAQRGCEEALGGSWTAAIPVSHGHLAWLVVSEIRSDTVRKQESNLENNREKDNSIKTLLHLQIPYNSSLTAKDRKNIDFLRSFKVNHNALRNFCLIAYLKKLQKMTRHTLTPWQPFFFGTHYKPCRQCNSWCLSSVVGWETCPDCQAPTLCALTGDKQLGHLL